MRQILATVALREGEHGKAFAKRVCELGFTVQARSDGKAAERLAIASSTTMSDREKFEKLGLGRPVDADAPDFFTNMFQDKNIDIQTGQLLGRYIAEERDSARLLRSCYEELKCAAEAAPAAAGADLVSLETKVDALCRAVDDLRQIVCAQTMEPALRT